MSVIIFLCQNFMILTVFSLIQGCHGGYHERRLLSNLLRDYNPLERPVINESEPILVSFYLTFQQIIDLDEKNQILQSSIWLNMEWIDTNLRWNASEYPGIKNIRVSANKIWTPDVLLYNSADDKIDSTLHTNVVVESNGSCLWVPPGIFRSTCKVDITWFPFDDQKCILKFGSWTYDGLALDLRLSNEEGGDTSTYIPSGEWILIGVPAKRRVLQYACCPETYVDITFTVHIRRRTLYYTFNLIVPCVLISSMTLLGFALPPDSGEKLTLGVTILLSMTVFMLQLSETLPPTSESISIIGTYFACIMIMVAFSVVMTVVVLNFHHRATSEYQEMPPCVRRVILVWLPWVLRMEKPGIKPPPNTNKNKSPSPKPGSASGASSNVNKSPTSGSHQHHPSCRNDLSYTISSKGYCDPIIRSNATHHHHSHLNHTTANTNFSCKWDSTDTETGLVLPNSGLTAGLDDAYLANLIAARGSCPCCYNNLKSYAQALHAAGGVLPGLTTVDPTGSEQISVTLDEQDLPGVGLSNGDSNGPDPLLNHSPTNPNGGHSGQAPSCCSLLCKGREVSAILRELRFITNRMRKEDEIEEIIGEWKFAAMVMDRLCLIVFSSFTAVSTAACLIPPANLQH